MTLKSGTSQACAACKFQRRKCTPECQLAPYFPPDKTDIFQNAHKLFGVSNIGKILKSVEPSDRSEAMASIIYQSNIRAKYPVRGCVEVIEQYMYQIKQYEHELHMVHSMIAFSQQQQQIQPDTLDNNQLALGIGPFHSSSSPQTPNPAQLVAHPYEASENYSFASCCTNADENIAANPPMWIHQPNSNNFGGNNPEIKGSNPASMREEPVQEYDETKPCFDPNIFDKQCYADSKKAYDSSPESSMTDAMQSMEHVADDELKTAAACFSLTSVK